mmetsp:Transcript_28306/g.30921  ORF Transcript_28306/g.30921 Transcript_28306/m.30921 type:complete len:210 (+) Transcript_28306:1470-2099(+)
MLLPDPFDFCLSARSGFITAPVLLGLDDEEDEKVENDVGTYPSSDLIGLVRVDESTGRAVGGAERDGLISSERNKCSGSSKIAVWAGLGGSVDVNLAAVSVISWRFNVGVGLTVCLASTFSFPVIFITLFRLVNMLFFLLALPKSSPSLTASAGVFSTIPFSSSLINASSLRGLEEGLIEVFETMESFGVVSEDAAAISFNFAIFERST